jgi:hypothetical protein
VIVRASTGLRDSPPIGPATLEGLAIAAGLLLVAGLWTPVSGSVLAALAFWGVASEQPPDPWAGILLGTIGVALALIGPGAWSVDARLFGWRRIDLGGRRG